MRIGAVHQLFQDHDESSYYLTCFRNNKKIKRYGTPGLRDHDALSVGQTIWRTYITFRSFRFFYLFFSSMRVYRVRWFSP